MAGPAAEGAGSATGAAGAAGATQYTHMSVSVQHSSGALPSRYIVNVERLLDCLCEGGFRARPEFFECWEMHMQHSPQTVVTVPWGDERKCTTMEEDNMRFATFAATLGLGFRDAMNPSHKNFVKFSVSLNEVIDYIRSMIDLPRNTCFEPLVLETEQSFQTHGPMLQLVLSRE